MDEFELYNIMTIILSDEVSNKEANDALRTKCKKYMTRAEIIKAVLEGKEAVIER